MPLSPSRSPIEELKKAAIAQMQAGEPVWFGCDVGKRGSRSDGILDLDIYNLDGLFGTHFGMNKAERLEYGQSLMTHAMVFQGVNLDENGKPNRWRVENSWYLENGKPYIIESVGVFDITLSDPTLFYPISRAESRESFARLMERYPQPEKTAAENTAVPEKEPKPAYTEETVAVYPGDKNNLPYDVEIRTQVAVSQDHTTVLQPGHVRSGGRLYTRLPPAHAAAVLRQAPCPSKHQRRQPFFLHNQRVVSNPSYCPLLL